MTELVDLETGEIVTSADARASVTRAKNHVDGFWSEVRWQVDHQAWTLLGYTDLDELWSAEYESLDVAIKRDQRPELVASLRSVGQTQQAIADKLGVNHATVSRDLANANSGPSKIINERGQERPASYAPRPKPPPLSPEEADRLQREKDYRDGVRRTAGYLRAFLSGWDAAYSMRTMPNRSDVLAELDALDLDRFTRIEKETSWPSTRI